VAPSFFRFGFDLSSGRSLPLPPSQLLFFFFFGGFLISRCTRELVGITPNPFRPRQEDDAVLLGKDGIINHSFMPKIT